MLALIFVNGGTAAEARINYTPRYVKKTKRKRRKNKIPEWEAPIGDEIVKVWDEAIRASGVIVGNVLEGTLTTTSCVTDLDVSYGDVTGKMIIFTGGIANGDAARITGNMGGVLEFTGGLVPFAGGPSAFEALGIPIPYIPLSEAHIETFVIV